MIIPSVVISELDWYVLFLSACIRLLCLGRQKTTRRSISWSARAASRWILEKLKENTGVKVLKVQASEETLVGAGSGELVSAWIGRFGPYWGSIADTEIPIHYSESNLIAIRRMISR